MPSHVRPSFTPYNHPLTRPRCRHYPSILFSRSFQCVRLRPIYQFPIYIAYQNQASTPLRPIRYNRSSRLYGLRSSPRPFLHRKSQHPYFHTFTRLTILQSRYGCLIVAASGAFSCIPPLLGFLSSNLFTTASAGLAIALNISFGAPGQIAGVWIYKADEAKRGYPTGHVSLYF